MQSHSRAAVVLLFSLTAACAVNPATGERELSLVSEQQEVELGREAAAQVRTSIGLVPDEELQQYVSGIGRKLASESERPDLPWTFGVVDDPVANAFALPGGFIFVTRGLMNLLTNEAQLASVLGHEIAHVTARHSVSQVSKAQLAQLGLGLGGALFPDVQALAPALGAGVQLLFLKYGRDDEREADRLGFGYLREGGYALSAFPEVFGALQAAAPSEGRGLPTWLSTHPSSVERVREAEQLVAAAGAAPDGRVGREAYLQQIDGLIYGPNPRQGFFRDGVFYHPDLRFAVRFPEQWRTQNLAQAVVAVAPDGGAAIELTLAAAANARQALDRFAAQPGVRVTDVSRATFGGRSGVRARFRAQTERGSIDGLVAFIEHGNRTFQMVGYAARALAGAETPVRRTFQSFAPVTDPAILGVNPKRMSVARLEEARTLAEVARARSAAVPVEELVVLNQVPSSDTRFPQGSLLKLVVS